MPGLPPSIPGFSRRSFLLSTGAVFATSSAQGTGAADSTPNSDATPTLPIELDTPYGTITLKTAPQRIVCLDWFSPENLLEFGLTPIGLPEFNGNNLVLPEFTDKIKDVPTVENASLDVDMDLVTELKPDLILGLDWGAFDYDLLSEIAPTALFAWNGTSGDWNAFAEQFATAVAGQAGLISQQSAYDARISDMNETFGAQLETMKFAVINGSDANHFYLYVEDFAGAIVLRDAGIRMIDAAVGRSGTYLITSTEDLKLLADADVILVAADESGKPSPETSTLLDSPLFRQLRAARAGQVYPVIFGFPCSYGIALEFLLEVSTILAESHPA